jgi:uncharacterized protein (DUF342 family)
MRWEERGDDVWLIVEPGEGTRVEDVVHEFDAAGYCDLTVEAVERVLSTGEPEAVARLDARRRAGWIEVIVDDEGLTATLAVTPSGDMAMPLVHDDVMAALARAEIRLGVDHLLLSNLPLHLAGEYLVATGWRPQPGRDGHVEYLVEPTHEFRPEARRDGGVDFHAVATIPDVHSGQLLAALVDPSPGTPGRTVRGDAIVASPGAASELPTGDNVTVSEDGRRLHAATNGLLEVSGGRMSVRPDYVIDGDVDLETGSVEFSGDVIVRGSVQPGFSVCAGGQVVVLGDVEDAEVSGETLVWVRGAVVGEHSLIQCAGDVKVRTVHHGRIEARRSVYVEREAHEATILAGADLILERNRNRISGGACWAGNQVMAGEIGAVGGVRTRLSVGVDPFTAELLESLVAEVADHRRTLERVELAVTPFIDRPDVVAALEGNRRRAVEQLITVAASLRAQVLDIDRRIAELQPTDDGARPRVAARMALRPGVTITVREATYVARFTHHRVAATAIDGRVTLVPLGSETTPTAPPSAAPPVPA